MQDVSRAPGRRLAGAVAGAAAALLTVVAAGAANAPAPAAPASLCGQTTTHPATWSHVIWIFMENHGFDQIIGSSSAPFLNSLAATCGLATNYHSITHPSLPNYLGATSGQPLATSDCLPSACSQSATSLFQQMTNNGKEWRAYEESMPSNCVKTDSGGYVAHHDPAVYYTPIAARCAQWTVPMGSTTSGSFLSDLNGNSLPAFSFVTPGHCHDMDVCDVATGDSFLSSWMDVIASSASYRSGTTALFITFDEGADPDQSSDCTTATTPDCHVATWVVAPSVPHGARSATDFNHYSLLRTTEQLLGTTTFLGHAAGATSMRSAFNI